MFRHLSILLALGLTSTAAIGDQGFPDLRKNTIECHHNLTDQMYKMLDIYQEHNLVDAYEAVFKAWGCKLNPTTTEAPDVAYNDLPDPLLPPYNPNQQPQPLPQLPFPGFQGAGMPPFSGWQGNPYGNGYGNPYGYGNPVGNGNHPYGKGYGKRWGRRRQGGGNRNPWQQIPSWNQTYNPPQGIPESYPPTMPVLY